MEWARALEHLHVIDDRKASKHVVQPLHGLAVTGRVDFSLTRYEVQAVIDEAGKGLGKALLL